LSSVAAEIALDGLVQFFEMEFHQEIEAPEFQRILANRVSRTKEDKRRFSAVR